MPTLSNPYSAADVIGQKHKAPNLYDPGWGLFCVYSGRSGG
jgi:hypothetical protein